MRQITDANTLNIEPGCYVDGHWGWRGAIHLLEQFDGIAYELDDDDRALIERYGAACDMADAEAMVDLTDQAEEMLNNALRLGLVAHWHDGEFFVSDDDAEAEAEAERAEAEAQYRHDRWADETYG